MNFFRGNLRHRLWAGVAMVACGSVGAVHAAEVRGPFGLAGHSVSDAELDNLRGRFVDGREITFFGIRMATSWQREGGRAHNMEMHVNFDMSRGRYQPQLTMFRSRDIGPESRNAVVNTLDNVSDNGELESISGVVQNIQVAGDNNIVHNGVDWLVTDRPTAANRSALVEVNQAGRQTHLTDEGVATEVSVDAEGIGYQVDIPDVGVVSQQISRSQFSGGNILQSTQLDSNLNRVLNQIGLTVELSPQVQGRAGLQRFHQVLQNIRGL